MPETVTSTHALRTTVRSRTLVVLIEGLHRFPACAAAHICPQGSWEARRCNTRDPTTWHRSLNSKPHACLANRSPSAHADALATGGHRLPACAAAHACPSRTRARRCHPREPTTWHRCSRRRPHSSLAGRLASADVSRVRAGFSQTPACATAHAHVCSLARS